VHRLAAARGTTAALLGDQLIRNAVALFDLPEVL
jgi:hypothetical protein